MARISRVIFPGVGHHITQRGNRRQQTFFEEADYRLYKSLMAEWCARFGVEVWAYCLMPNHVHLIAAPAEQDSLRQAMGEAHRRYTRAVNFRQEWRGHLWQGRFASYPMDEPHLLQAARYVELNPVRAGMAARPQDYPYSSAAAHLSGQDDELVKVTPLLERVRDWGSFLNTPLFEDQLETIRRHERTGRPLADENYVETWEKLLGRLLRPQKPGRKGKERREGRI